MVHGGYLLITDIIDFSDRDVNNYKMYEASKTTII